METSSRLLNPLAERRARSHLVLNVEELETAGTLRKWKSVPDSNLNNDIRKSSTSPFWSLELLYKITDVILVICALTFIISSIASIILWLYGLPWVKGLIVFVFHHS